MNKAELAQSIAVKTGMSKKDAEASIKAFMETVAGELKEGKEVQLVGFGTFKTSKRAARQGRNPQTGAVVEIPASINPVFKPGKQLKETINA